MTLRDRSDGGRGEADPHKEHSRTKRRLAWCLPLGVLCLVCAGVLLAIDPVQIVTTKKTRVRVNSSFHQLLGQPMSGAHVSVSLFNITNAPRFESGEDQTLRVREVGPFTYKETRYNENLEIDEEAELVRYEPRIETEFVPEESAAHPDDVTLALPNLALLGLASILRSYNYLTRAGFNALVSQLDSQPVVTVNASAYLWGYKEPLLTFAHNLLPGYVNFDKLGLLDQIYSKKASNRLEVSARDEEKFMIKTRNGQKKLPMMGTMDNADNCEICDDFTNAYEGIAYPSPTTSKTLIRMFRNGVCRILPMEYDKTIVYDNGVEGLLFNLSNSFFSMDHNVNNSRILDLHECFLGIPLALSKAYFQDVDPEVYKRIEGIPKPDPTKQSYIVIEPMIALALEAVIRVQMNLVLPDLSFNCKAGRYSHLVLPLVHLDIVQPPLLQETNDMLYGLHVSAPRALWLVRAAVAVAGGALLAYCTALYALRKRKKTETPPPAVPLTQQPLLK